MKRPLAIILCCLFLLLAGLFMASSTDIGDTSIECEEGDIMEVSNGVWECISNILISENVFLPQYIFSHTDKTQLVAGVNTWTNITFDQENADIKRGIAHSGIDQTNDTFIIMISGIYNIDYDIDLEDTSPSASDIDVAARLIFTNGTEVIGSVFETDITKQGAEIELSHNFLVEAAAGDQFVFQFIAQDTDVVISTHGTYGDSPESVTIIIHKIANIES